MRATENATNPPLLPRKKTVIAWAAVYLASDEAKFVTGQVLSPNDGRHMSQ